MKTLSYFFMYIGCALMISVVLVFTNIIQFITKDWQWLLLLFSGMCLSCIGFCIDSYLQPKSNWIEAERRDKLINNMLVASILSFVLVIAVLVGHWKGSL